MPELPEVEIIRRGLEKYLVGKKLLKLQIIDPRLFQSNIFHLKGGKIIILRRFGKCLVIGLDNSYSIAIHVKMTGQLIFQDSNINTHLELSTKHTRAIFYLNNGAKLFFNDIRKFGWLKIVKTLQVNNLTFFKNLGPDSLKDLTPNYLFKITQRSSLPIKVLIMDQNKISGIGNIYANDALNLAKINPARKAKSLTVKDTNKLYISILEVLNRGLRYGGSSEVNYVNADGKQGSYQNHRLVYNRKGEKCFNCKGVIRKIKLGGRGTYFCPNCQK